MSTIKDAYAPIDIHKPREGGWPAVAPPMTFHEGRAAARRLWRWAEGQTFNGAIVETTGNRYTWTFWDKGFLNLRVNAGKGWRSFAHDMSHMFYQRANPGCRPHSKDHARFERKLVKEIVRRGWLDGALRAKPAPEASWPVNDADLLAQKLARLREREKAWKTKAKRAATALAKIAKETRKLERAKEKLA